MWNSISSSLRIAKQRERLEKDSIIKPIYFPLIISCSSSSSSIGLSRPNSIYNIGSDVDFQFWRAGMIAIHTTHQKFQWPKNILVNGRKNVSMA